MLSLCVFFAASIASEELAFEFVLWCQAMSERSSVRDILFI